MRVKSSHKNTNNKKIQFCPYCGARLSNSDRFCPNCGEQVINDFQGGYSYIKPEDSNNAQGNESYTPNFQMSHDQATEKANTSNKSTKRKYVYEGEIHKCPNCGEVLDAFVTVCPSCGYEIRDVENSSAVQEFARRMSMATTDREKINIIRNFPIPNTKEDIMEFVVLASTNINENQNIDDEVSDAWYAKLQQAYQKANISFKDQPEFSRVEESYNQIKKLRNRNRVSKFISSLFHHRIVQVVIAILILIILVEACSAFSRSSSQSSSVVDEVYEWPTSGLSQYLPEPTTSNGKIRDDNEKRFSIDLGNVSEDQFKEYVSACKEKGFTIDVTENDMVFYAYNEEQYDLDIFYYSSSSRMNIYLDAPMQMAEIRWPTSDLVKQIPKPDKQVGHIDTEQDNKFIVYIDDINSDEFNEYIDQCMDKGFTVDYYRSEDTFHAYNKKGDYLEVKEQIFDIMYILIKEPNED